MNAKLKVVDFYRGEPGDLHYREERFFESKYRPLLLRATFLFMEVAVFVAVVTGLIFNENLYLFALFTVSATMALYFSWKLYKLPDVDLIHFCGDYFLRINRESKTMYLAKYSSMCPKCRGNVVLSRWFKENVGYVGRCKKYQGAHIYTFDHVFLRGGEFKGMLW